MVNIIEYEDRYAADFKLLNLEWLDRYNLTEDLDRQVLDDPKERSWTREDICLALLNEEVVGTSALIREHDQVFELAKMSVAPSHRGQGISKLLMEKCLDKARELEAKKLVLFSNSQLQTALRLYSQYGFQHVPIEDSPFVTADVKMELHF